MHCRELLQAQQSVLHIPMRLSDLACDIQASAPALQPVPDASPGFVLRHMSHENSHCSA